MFLRFILRYWSEIRDKNHFQVELTLLSRLEVPLKAFLTLKGDREGSKLFNPIFTGAGGHVVTFFNSQDGNDQVKKVYGSKSAKLKDDSLSYFIKDCNKQLF